MGVYSLARSGVTNFQKYSDFLAGNAGLLPPSFELISTQILGSDTTTVTFSSIPSTYKHLQLRVVSKATNTGINLDYGVLRFNGDSGANYSWHKQLGDGYSLSYQSGTSAAYMQFGLFNGNTSAPRYWFGSEIIDILDYADTNKNKSARSVSGDANPNFQRVGMIAGAWYSTAAINSISYTPLTGTSWITGSRFSLYGVKG